MRAADDWNLIVVARIRRNVWQRIETQQGLRLRADGNQVAGKGQSGSRIKDLDGLTLGIQGIREVPGTLCGIRYQGGLRGGVAISRPLVAHKKVGTSAPYMRNSERASQRGHSGDPVVTGLRCVLPAQGKGPGIQGGIVENDADAPGVESFGPVAISPKRLKLRERRGRSVVYASVDEEAIGGLLIELVIGYPGRCGRFVFRFRCLVLGRGWRDMLLPGAGRRGRFDLSLDLVERQHAQFPFSCTAISGRHLLLDGRKALHFDFNRPGSVRQIREREQTLLIGDRNEFLVALCRDYRCAGHRKPPERHLPVVFGSGGET